MTTKRKAHFFLAGSTKSICGNMKKVNTSPHDVQIGDPDDVCKHCALRRASMVAPL